MAVTDSMSQYTYTFLRSQTPSSWSRTIGLNYLMNSLTVFKDFQNIHEVYAPFLSVCNDNKPLFSSCLPRVLILCQFFVLLVSVCCLPDLCLFPTLSTDLCFLDCTALFFSKHSLTAFASVWANFTRPYPVKEVPTLTKNFFFSLLLNVKLLKFSLFCCCFLYKAAVRSR